MIRHSSRLLTQITYLKQIEESSIKGLVHQFSTSTGELSIESMESLTAGKCPFHHHETSNKSSPSNESSNQEYSSYSSTSFNSISNHRSSSQPVIVDNVRLIDKVKKLFKHPFGSPTTQAQQDYLRIPRTSDSVFPGLTSVFRLQANGGVSQLHKHCDKLHKKHGAIYREQLGPVEGKCS